LEKPWFNGTSKSLNHPDAVKSLKEAFEYRKLSLTALDVAAMAAELNHKLAMGRIVNVYQLMDGALLLKIRVKSGELLNLMVEPKRRVSLTRFEEEKPRQPPSFCLSLRRRVKGGFIEAVEQYDFDRVLMVRVKVRGERFTLIFELFREGNVILVGEDNRIVTALHQKRMRDRNIVKGEVYVAPPLKGPPITSLSLQEFEQTFKGSEDIVVKTLINRLSIPPELAEEVCVRSGVKANVKANGLTEDELGRLYRSCLELIGRARSSSLEPRLLVKGGEYFNVLPFEFLSMKGFEQVPFPSFNEAVDEYFERMRMEEAKLKALKDAEMVVEGLRKSIKETEAKIARLKEEEQFNLKVAETITKHATLIQSVIDEVNKLRVQGLKWRDLKEVVEKRVFDPESPLRLVKDVEPIDESVKVHLDGLEFKVSLTGSVLRSASKYYDEAKTIRGKIRRGEEALKRLAKKLEEEKVKASEKVKAIPKPRRARRKKWYEKYRWFFTSNGLLVIGGRDAVQNEVIVKKYLEDKDLFLHADIQGAPVVVVKTAGKELPQTVIDEAAQFAAAYSRAWTLGLHSIDVYYVFGEQVSKEAPSGEYLPRGAFMVRGHRNYVKNVPLRVGIGIDGDGNLIAGPVNAISMRAKAYVVLAPGDQEAGRIAKAVKEEIVKRVESSLVEKVKAISIEEIQRFIPPGRSTITTR